MRNYWIALDQNQDPKCILRTVRIAINQFKNIPDEIAKAEGEGDCTVDSWKKAHRAIYTPFLKQWGIDDLDQAGVITEFFEVLF